MTKKPTRYELALFAQGAQKLQRTFDRRCCSSPISRHTTAAAEIYQPPAGGGTLRFNQSQNSQQLFDHLRRDGIVRPTGETRHESGVESERVGGRVQLAAVQSYALGFKRDCQIL